jgi:hypothetical protein
MNSNLNRFEFEFLKENPFGNWKQILFTWASKWLNATVDRQARPKPGPLAGPRRSGAARACLVRDGARSPRSGAGLGVAVAGLMTAKTRWDMRGNGLGTSAYAPLHMDREEDPHRRGLQGGGKGRRRGRKPVRK